MVWRFESENEGAGHAGCKSLPDVRQSPTAEVRAIGQCIGEEKGAYAKRTTMEEVLTV